MAISIKQGIIELEGLAQKIGIEDNDRLAKMLLPALKEVQNKLCDLNELKDSHQSNHKLINVLPYSAHEMIENISQSQKPEIYAMALLNDLIDVYKKAFNLIGISPKIRTVLF